MEDAQPIDDEVEIVDGVPVIAEVREIIPAPEAPVPALVSPALQAAAVAATGFVAGAATLALLHRRNTRRIATRSPSFRPVGPPAGSHRTYLVHVISRPLD
jgi:hypothetical protein